jgi:hypothetical protein
MADLHRIGRTELRLALGLDIEESASEKLSDRYSIIDW